MRAASPKTALAALALTALAVALLIWTLAPHGGRTLGGDGSGGSAAASGTDLERRITDYTARFGADTGYLPPRRADREAVAHAVGLLLDGRRAQAAARLAALDFDLRTVTDSATGRRYAEIADRTDTGPAPRGWGRVYLDLSAPVRWSVQVPHPVADARTEQLGVGVLRGTPGGALVLAGAHRDAGTGDAADVAHRRDTVFAAVCAELAGRGLPGLQIHGFADDSAPAYDVIASTGRATHESRTAARALATALRTRDFTGLPRLGPLLPPGGPHQRTGPHRRGPGQHLPPRRVRQRRPHRPPGGRPRRRGDERGDRALGGRLGAGAASPVTSPGGGAAQDSASSLASHRPARAAASCQGPPAAYSNALRAPVRSPDPRRLAPRLMADMPPWTGCPVAMTRR